MEGLGLVLLIFVGLFVIVWVLETVLDGVVSGLIALIAAPFKAYKKKEQENKLDTYVNGVYFETAVPPAQLYDALSAHLREGDFHPTNLVIVQHEEMGRHNVGFAWKPEVKFHVEGGGELQGSGEPVVEAEVSYDVSGPRTVGRMRLTRFSRDRDWTDEALMENALPWCFEPIHKLDPNAKPTRTPPQPL